MRLIYSAGQERVQHGVNGEFYKCFCRQLIKQVNKIYICYWQGRRLVFIELKTCDVFLCSVDISWVRVYYVNFCFLCYIYVTDWPTGRSEIFKILADVASDSIFNIFS